MMETDENGILTDSELQRAYKEWEAQDFAVNYIRASRGHYEDTMGVAARAQHEHDVEVVKKVFGGPYPINTPGASTLLKAILTPGASTLLKAILSALKAKEA